MRAIFTGKALIQRVQVAATLCLLSCVLIDRADGALIQLISNGGFESGFSGWTSPTGNWYVDQVGTTAPLSGLPTQGNPLGGMTYAVSDQSGSGVHILLQNFVMPSNVVSLQLSFQMFVNDWSNTPIVNPAGLTTSAGPNQHARVDVLKGFVNPFSISPSDVIDNLYAGVDAGPDPNPWPIYQYALNPGSFVAGSTYTLRFAEVDTQYFLTMGVDNVSLIATTADAPAPVPEPSSLVLLLSGGAVGLVRYGRRRRYGGRTQVA